MLIDCHTHLESFNNDEVATILDRAQRVGVGLVVTAGTTLESSERCVRLTSRFPGLFSGIGLHPMDLTGPVGGDTNHRLRELACSTDKVVVVSETGLDFTNGMPDRATQYQAFREQIRLARDLGLPIVFHSREAHEETLRVLREEQAYQVGGAMHYFQADRRIAQQAIDLGFFISLARPLLRLPHVQKVATSIPLEHVLLESDTAPQPFKAKRENWTEPRHVRYIAEKLACLHHRPVEEIEAITQQNFRYMTRSRRESVDSFLAAQENDADPPLQEHGDVVPSK